MCGLRLDPTPHSRFVAQVLFTELALQIAFLTLDDAALNHLQRDRQKKDSPQRVRQARDACIDHRHRAISGVASILERTLCNHVWHRLIGVSRCTSLSHRPFEPTYEQHADTKKWPSEAARYPARYKGHWKPSIEQQAKNQRCHVDQRRGRNHPCLVLLVTGHKCLPSSLD